MRSSGDVTWRRILVDPDDTTLLSVGAKTYRPGKVLARHVRTRDRACWFPTCDQPATGCDLDHTIPFDAITGLTVPGNLGVACEHHHQYKHAQPETANAPPRLTQPTPGRCDWTLPTGHTYTVDPPPLLDPDDPLLPRRAPVGTRARGFEDIHSPAELGMHALIRGYEHGYNTGRQAA